MLVNSLGMVAWEHNPSYMEDRQKRIKVRAGSGFKGSTLSKKWLQQSGGRALTRGERKHTALSSNPHTAKRKKWKKRSQLCLSHCQKQHIYNI
jgi:hypothetical protein